MHAEPPIARIAIGAYSGGPVITGVRRSLLHTARFRIPWRCTVLSDTRREIPAPGYPMPRSASAADRRTQLIEQRRKVDYDSYDVTVDELLRRLNDNRIDIAPVYQRQFRWDSERHLVSWIGRLGHSDSPLFMATNTGAGLATPGKS